MAWSPRYIVRKAPGVGGAPIGEREPCLVIRAQDRLAVPTLAGYLAAYNEIDDGDPQVLRDLLDHFVTLVVWQSENRDKMKWADR